MKQAIRTVVLGSTLTVLTCGLAAATLAQETQTVFYGNISDSKCGLRHPPPGDYKACTVTCVRAGAAYVLADSAHNRVYRLSNQAQASRFPGQSVVIRGRLHGDTIVPYKIELAK
jgi:hypothetical protein